ncbi:MAG: RAMP superfamily CRISPR-associated protein [Desulfosoma sp.]|uniref:RAMP superfamily CRISPR-associated protein n=1 Tax=Desulfosoma sp. TaxID=2603217 RepID=UPI004049399F
MRRNQCLRTYQVRFVTPAFLGGADQSGQWRVPPFKALLRKWWRIVWWNAQERPSLENLRLWESRLFGTTAGLEAGASRIRLRIDTWRQGSLRKNHFDNVKCGEIVHREVKRKLNAALYLGYGPIGWDKAQKRPGLQRLSAVGTDEKGQLTLMYPAELDRDMTQTMRLLALFGCLGARSRNGWGSLSLYDASQNVSDLFDENVLDHKSRSAREWLDRLAVPWIDALQHDWCHALGRDDKGLLLWCTDSRERWEDVLTLLARIKIHLRTQFAFHEQGPHTKLCERHILAYPVTNHVLQAWGDDKRSANQLFFKVHAVGGGFCGLVAHLTHGMPQVLKRALKEKTPEQDLCSMEHSVWSRVHESLDKQLVRLP